ncbi:hypothetical protein AMAG_14987 [Allomyces macrogynus ATCC 38327]|uniref:Uncharacterized protein n=1 Tax=Allomyces macrogynus (strain ATCC 38327) TaxID=578462 RepID=A0A0L0T839_ALLM3|nr:hypothetical protein AMAG_14987 [Allomyces macrogynus ATCC 38327]|eukprot:KNE70890.1 hypothetical protein AMAG_14987 [Allomyces macrogynus ATCC 38327]
MLLGTPGAAVPLPPEVPPTAASVSPRRRASSTSSTLSPTPCLPSVHRDACSIHHDATQQPSAPFTNAPKASGAPSLIYSLDAPHSDRSHDTHAPALAAAADGGDHAPSWPASRPTSASSLPALAGTNSSPLGRSMPPPVSPPDATTGPTVVLHLATSASVSRQQTCTSAAAPKPCPTAAANAPTWRPPVDGATRVSGTAAAPMCPPRQARTLSTAPLAMPTLSSPYLPTTAGTGGAIPLIPPMMLVPSLPLPSLAATLQPMPAGPADVGGTARPPTYRILPPPAAAMRWLLAAPPPLSALSFAAVTAAAAAPCAVPLRTMAAMALARDDAGGLAPRRDLGTTRATSTAATDGESATNATTDTAALSADETAAAALMNPVDLLPALEMHEALLDLSTTNSKARGDTAERRHAFLRTLASMQAIVRDRLYRARACTMEQYFATRHNISRAQVYRLLDCYKIIHELDDFPEKPLKQRVCRTLKKVAPTAAERRQVWAAVLARFGTNATAVASLTSGDIITTWRDATAAVVTTATPAASEPEPAASPPPTTTAPGPARTLAPRTCRKLQISPSLGRPGAARAAATTGCCGSQWPRRRQRLSRRQLARLHQRAVTAMWPLPHRHPRPCTSRPTFKHPPPPLPLQQRWPVLAAPSSSPALVPAAGPADLSLKRKRKSSSVPLSPQAPRSPRAKRMTLEPSVTSPSSLQVTEEPRAAVKMPVDAHDASLKPPAVVESSPAPAVVGRVFSAQHASFPPALSGKLDTVPVDYAEVADVAMAEVAAAAAFYATPPSAAVAESSPASQSSDPATAAPLTDPVPSDCASTATRITSAITDMDLDASSMGYLTAGTASLTQTAAAMVNSRDKEGAMDGMDVADASATFTLYSAATAAAAAQDERVICSPGLYQLDYGLRHPSSQGQTYPMQPPPTSAHRAHPPPPPPPSRAYAAHFHAHAAAANWSFQLFPAKCNYHDHPIGDAPAHFAPMCRRISRRP